MFKTFLYNSFPQCTKALKYFLLSLFVLLIPALVKAQEMDSLEIAQKLQSTYEKALNLVADFKQTTAMKFSSRVRQGSGTMIFRKPGRMRWDYRSPDYQVLISDVETISMYFEKSNQMIVSNAREYLQSDVTYSFFAGTGDILKDFDVSDPDLVTDSMDNSFLIKLTPRSSHPHVSSIHAWISHDSFLITHLQIVDHFETVTDLFFFNILINADHYDSREIKEDLFLFIPPADTEIIEQY
jgi:outer membrane lipoprotein carrier protein